VTNELLNGWTPERKKRQAELIKGWKPWEHSTGAKTNEGKDISKMNAYKHGLRSEGVKAIRRALKNVSI
tara:strand:+ start:568 stop:774 length:207 start_codon:yes stop_codon:yes gene_type:complete